MVIERCVRVLLLCVENKLLIENDDFLKTFAKLNENVEIHENEHISELLTTIYALLKKKSDKFEVEYIKYRREILRTKEVFKAERKQLAIIDPAKFFKKIC